MKAEDAGLPERGRASSWREPLLAGAIYALVTVGFLWPMPKDPSRFTTPNPDVYGCSWVLAWVVRQALQDPARLFEANIYYPNPSSLAFTESLLPQAVQAAPILAAGGGALLSHNVVLMLSFPLAGVGAFLLARDLSGSARGAFLAGLAYAFVPRRFVELVHVQSLSTQWLPLAILYARRSALQGRPRHFVLLGVFFILQALSSGYYAVLVGLAVGLVTLWHIREATRLKTLWPLLGTLALALLLIIPVFLPYRAMLHRQEQLRGYSLERTREDLIWWSADWTGYLSAGRYGALPHERWLRGRGALYPSLTVLVLAGIAVWRARRNPGAVGLAGLWTGVGILLSLGPTIQLGPFRLPGPMEALRHLPGVSMLRTPERMGVLAVLGLGTLAALGWAQLTRNRRANVPTLAATVAILAELYPVGLAREIRPEPTPPPTVQWLARSPRGAVLELPWDHETQDFGGLYIYWSTYHWQPMVNGWGGWEPKGSFRLGVLGKRFPSRFSSRQLRKAGVRYVVVHRDLIPPDRPGRRAVASSTADLPRGVALVAEFGPHRIYEIDPRGPTERPGKVS